jgi:hypothetical protein
VKAVPPALENGGAVCLREARPAGIHGTVGRRAMARTSINDVCPANFGVECNIII